VNTPYAGDDEKTAETKEVPSGGVLELLANPRSLHHQVVRSRVVRLRDSYDEHDLVMGTDDVFVDALRLLIYDPTMLVVLPRRLMRVGLTFALDDIVVG
jgi:hypothetical protein